MKDTKNKPDWSLVNLKNLEGIVRAREYGTKKYKDPENWKNVAPADYLAAMIRHIAQMQDKGLYSRDAESGLLHIDHLATNAYFLSYFARMNK